MISELLKSESKVTQRLFEQFYVDGAAVLDVNASSHWKNFSKNISINTARKNLELNGFGFGESDRLGILTRLLAWICIFIHLRKFSDQRLSQRVKSARKIVKKMGLHFSLDAFRQVATLNLLVKHIERGFTPNQILVIGDGHGILSALIHAEYPKAQIFLVDLGAVLLFQSHYLNVIFPFTPQLLVEEKKGLTEGATFIFCPAGNINMLHNEFDLAINVASMQEMTPAVIESYFKFLRKSKTKLFYCCNRLEKTLEGGEVVRFMDYPWGLMDKHIVDELTPWHKWFFSPRFSTNNVKFMGVPIPFLQKYDGPHWHRLTQMKD
jgi:putative sugar O-methyltransferase